MNVLLFLGRAEEGNMIRVVAQAVQKKVIGGPIVPYCVLICPVH